MALKSKRSQEGYLLIDNRGGPGISEDFINSLPPEKRGPIVREGACFESAVITCSHCHTQVVLNPDRSRPRNYCSKCDHYVCDSPTCIIECVPLNSVLDKLQNEALHLIGKG